MNTNLEKKSEETFVSLKEVLDFCVSVLNKEIDKDGVEEFLNKIFIKHYLPILDKYQCVIYLSNICLYSSYNEMTVIALEEKKFWNVLLAYTNIQTTGWEKLETEENYDIIFSVLGDIFLEVCGKDYARTIKMFDDLNNFNNISSLLDLLYTMDSGKIDDVTKGLKNQFKILNENKDLIDSMTNSSVQI